MKETFEKLAKKYHGKFTYEDKLNPVFTTSTPGVKHNQQTFKLLFNLKSAEIELYNGMGIINEGRIVSSLMDISEHYDFSISFKDHFSRLFLFGRPFYNIESNNLNVKEFIQGSDSFHELLVLSKKYKFYPDTTGKSSAGFYEITTVYSNLFKERAELLDPLCKFHIDLVNWFQDL